MEKKGNRFPIDHPELFKEVTKDNQKSETTTTKNAYQKKLDLILENKQIKKVMKQESPQPNSSQNATQGAQSNEQKENSIFDIQKQIYGFIFVFDLKKEAMSMTLNPVKVFLEIIKKMIFCRLKASWLI